MGIRNLQGEPWHIEYLKRPKDEFGNKRRQRRNCVYFLQSDSHCRMYQSECHGVVHCSIYSEDRNNLIRQLNIDSEERTIQQAYIILEELAELIKRRIIRHLFLDEAFHIKTIASKLHEFITCLNIEYACGRKKDAKYILLLSMHWINKNKSAMYGVNALLPLLLDSIWLQQQNMEYSQLIASYKPQSYNKDETKVAFLECKSIDELIHNHRPTNGLIEYSRSLSEGMTWDKLVSFYEYCIPIQIKYRTSNSKYLEELKNT